MEDSLRNNGGIYRKSIRIRVFLWFCFVILAFLPGILANCFPIKRQNPSFLTERPILSISFRSNLGWILQEAGEKQFLYISGDKGGKWRKTETPTNFSAVFFVSKLLGWALKRYSEPLENAALYSTHDGGIHWNKISVLMPPPGRSLYVQTGLLFTDAKHGWVIGSDPSGESLVWQTKDGGTSFHLDAAVSDRFQISRGIFAGASDSVWLVGNRSILFTSDEGRTWQTQVSAEEPHGFPIGLSLAGGIARESGKAWAIGSAATGVILSSKDDGAHWYQVYESQATAFFTSIDFWDQSHGCAVGASRTLHCTLDGGTSWQERRVLPASSRESHSEGTIFTQIAFADRGRHVYVLSAEGLLYASSDGGETWSQFDPSASVKRE